MEDQSTPPSFRLLEEFPASSSDLRSKRSFWNYIYFCLFYSIAHATVDSVLAFATAELGPDAGSYSGFSLYIFYTLSSLLLAKSVLRKFGPKMSVFFGLVGLLMYVLSFFLAILIPSISFPIFVLGASIGGVGAGFLWTGQGCYYTLNANQYSALSSSSNSRTLSDFASIFAIFYLSFETAFKLLATFVYLSFSHSSNSNIWKPIVFGIYSASAFLSVILYYFMVQELKDPSTEKEKRLRSSHIHNNNILSSKSRSNSKSSSQKGLIEQREQEVEEEEEGDGDHEDNVDPTEDLPDIQIQSQVHQSLPCFSSLFSCCFGSRSREVAGETGAVALALIKSTRLQFLMPFQICFGFSAGFFGYYVNGFIVNTYLGDGYIGLLSALTTLSAVLVSALSAKVCSFFPELTETQLRTRNRLRNQNVVGGGGEGEDIYLKPVHGKWFVMIIGGLCFLFSGLPLLFISDSTISHWSFVIFYFLIHGAARGIWESTNKSVFADYFSASKDREVAFASLYFMSGLAGAVAYIAYQNMNRNQLALLNTIIPLIALVSYHLSSGVSIMSMFRTS